MQPSHHLPLSAGNSLPIYLMPNVFSAHPSCGKVDDWLPRTAPHNNRLCMVTVTEGRKLSNSQIPLAKNSSNQKSLRLVTSCLCVLVWGAENM